MEASFTGYKKKDWIIAIALAVVVLLTAGARLSYGMPDWGDDFAGYILEGIAIAEGTLEEQARENYVMHAAPFSSEVTEDGLVYVWGFPLLLSFVYRLAGFEAMNGGGLLLYKLPSLICFALTAAVLYLFYRRYLKAAPAAVLCLIFAVSGNLIEAIDLLNVDIPFLFFVFLTLLVTQALISAQNDAEAGKRPWILAVLLGLSMWMTCETRLNGFTVVGVAALQLLIALIKRKSKPGAGLIVLNLLPYAVFMLLKLVSEAILAPATQNVSDVGRLQLSDLTANIWYYYYITVSYLKSLTGGIIPYLWPLLCILLAVGLFKEGFKLRMLPLTALFAGTYAILFTLPYTQGLRYLFYVLPIMLMFMAFGAVHIFTWVFSMPKIKPLGKYAATVLALVLLTAAYLPAVKAGAYNVQSFGQCARSDVYSPQAMDIYRYIGENVEDDEIIAFVKPRALHLNTGKAAFMLGVNGHELEDADYYLFSSEINNALELEVHEAISQSAEPVYANEVFELYKLK